MKSKILFLLPIVLILSYCNQAKSSQRMAFIRIEQKKVIDAKKIIKNFYVSYAANVSNGFDVENDALLAQNLTQSLIERVQRMKASTQSDPIIRAQDFNLNDLSSFDVKHLAGEWYLVSYTQNTVQGKCIEIPVKTTNVNGKFLIDYITPEWNNSLYGDKLLSKKKYLPIVDTTSSSLAFLKTFYAAYTMEYCNMPVDLLGRLGDLCKKYCTQNALEAIRKAKNYTENPNYDLLIDYSDFDILWIPTLTFTHLEEELYKVSYIKWQNVTTNIYITIIKKENMYFIDHIRVEDRY